LAIGRANAVAEAPARRYALDDLLAVMARLRDKDAGCPWDVAQSYATIAPYTIEEAYEVADAIARDDREALKEELGDLLLQVVYHAQMASEEGRFDFADVVDGITRKMVRRHPHVFGDAKRVEFLATDMWGRIKDAEKAERGGVNPLSPLRRRTACLPRVDARGEASEACRQDWFRLGKRVARSRQGERGTRRTQGGRRGA
jgi:MazG family protein